MIDNEPTLHLHGLLEAYRHGLFPMGESVDDPSVFWCAPDPRAIFPLNKLIVSTSLGKTLRQNRFDVRVDYDFNAVIQACATIPRKPQADEEEAGSWINPLIRNSFLALHKQGLAHSVECWQDGHLVGGLYGLALGGAFFGESMFSTARDASKVALMHLAARLIAGGFTVLDTQYLTPHLASLGAIEISRKAYLQKLTTALTLPADFNRLPVITHLDGRAVLAIISANQA